MPKLFDESKHRKGDALTDGDQLMSIVKLAREYLDLLEHISCYGQRWEGHPEQVEIDKMAIRLDNICVDKSDLEAMLDRWDERSAQERRDYESQACQIQTDGLATGRG